MQRARRAPEDLKAPVCPPALSMVGPGRLQLLAELFCFCLWQSCWRCRKLMRCFQVNVLVAGVEKQRGWKMR